MSEVGMARSLTFNMEKDLLLIMAYQYCQKKE